ncbi:MAG: isoprenylcysteine carboxylmethyltransferase family protein [Rhodospirillales bacterium]|nr:isoprenylcysteine carboxylmethyltransferase family protein [Alphaproteobacteria bacterium]MBL6948356.1 isoprenylcysteine carboxylmethyltransferase family protein [Rhodospirillales bacterium]
MEPLAANLIYALGWISFGAVHSALSSSAVKQRLAPLFGAYYRLSYNLFAGIHIAAVWVFGQWALDASPFDLEPAVASALTGVRWLGILVLLLALREYDLGRFSGLSQIRSHRQGLPDPGDEPLITDGMHRFVRHPLYLGAHMILWGGAANPFGLATAILGSLYLIVGARHEEGSLRALHGEAYEEYRRRVPALIPGITPRPGGS